MLHHLCYASGNSEPGHAQPTITVARQRISNYAAGFLRTNAQAVLADGHRGPVDYLRLLFTTDQTIESLWRTAPGNNGHARSFTSTRTSGVRALMDPEGTIEWVLSLAGHGSAADDDDGDRDRRHEPAPGARWWSRAGPPS